MAHAPFAAETLHHEQRNECTISNGHDAPRPAVNAHHPPRRIQLATSRRVRSSQTIFIRIIYTSQFVKTVGLEDVFGFSEIRISNFLTNKKGNLREKLVNSQSWQGHKDLNPEPTVLETAALPIELYPYI